MSLPHQLLHLSRYSYAPADGERLTSAVVIESLLSALSIARGALAAAPGRAPVHTLAIIDAALCTATVPPQFNHRSKPVMSTDADKTMLYRGFNIAPPHAHTDADSLWSATDNHGEVLQAANEQQLRNLIDLFYEAPAQGKGLA